MRYYSSVSNNHIWPEPHTAPGLEVATSGVQRSRQPKTACRRLLRVAAMRDRGQTTWASWWARQQCCAGLG